MQASRDATDADIIVCATDSRVVVSEPTSTRARIVVSLGADADDQSELSAAWINAARIHVDHPDSARIGDLRRWVSAGEFDASAILDLGRLLADRGADASKREVFVSTGSALLDNFTIEYLIRRTGAIDRPGCQDSRRF
jgi:ornithine cyclodeaminase/alanine dehydrogenase-like protein (mu-crystallin family)